MAEQAWISGVCDEMIESDDGACLAMDPYEILPVLRAMAALGYVAVKPQSPQTPYTHIQPSGAETSPDPMYGSS